MNRRQFCKGSLLGAAAMALPRGLLAEAAEGPSAGSGPDGKRPNILYVVLDEWGYYEMSGMGNRLLETPVIDRLAREGLRFTQLLAGGPVCAPTRCALLTGKHAGHMTVRANGGSDPIRDDEPTIASMLKAAGYATGGFGKWGIGGRGTTGVPEKHGFDVFFGYYDQVHAHSYFPRYLIRNSQEAPLEGNTGDFRTGKQFSHHLIYEQARQFIRDNKDRPFFCYCPWTPPHGQWGIPEDEPSWQKFKDKPWGDTPQGHSARVYAAMVNMADREIGELVALLGELGVADRTLVVVTGDNGGNDYFPSQEFPRGIFGPNVDPRTGKAFRGKKGDLYEGGLRVQAVANWPGRIKAGTVSEHLGYFPDVMPTLAEVAGVQPPADTDGISFAPTLFGRPAQREHEYLYWEFGQQVAVRIGNTKGVRPKTAAAWEIYDLAADIGEQHDLAADRPEVVQRMKAIAEQAHVQAVAGEVLDPALLAKDRTSNNPEGQPRPEKAGKQAKKDK